VYSDDGGRLLVCDPKKVRVCIVFDCLYPHTVGGAERWYRNLAERLAEAGHEVTYLTRRQWSRGSEPDVPGVTVLAVAPRMPLYVRGRRRISTALVFALGVLLHLGRHASRYDVVHMNATPFFPLLAAALVRRARRFRLVVDWFEVWTRAYWREYVGALGGWVAWRIQRACIRLPHSAFCFSRLHAGRLREEGFRGEMTVLEGAYSGPLETPSVRQADPVVVYAGRHTPEKRVPALVDAFSVARERIPELRLEIYGDGPERPLVLKRVAELGLDGAVEAAGFVPGARIDAALARALCLAQPSRREGFGLVVVEAAARGTPSVVVQDPDNAATELVEDGVNGVVASSVAPEALGSAIIRVHEAGQPLRESTATWFERNGERLSLQGSLETVIKAYSRPP
jgi:glycosyltransferase involved in cell wall biosynthesis